MTQNTRKDANASHAERRPIYVLRSNSFHWISRCRVAALTAVIVGAFGGPFNSFAQQVPATQPVAGSSTRMDQAGNGVPVVQIAAPNARGVSHNQFTQFNVGPEGQILNNSRDTVRTQLGGYILGNTNLQPNTPARVILNEVTSTNPSQLNGYMEVAGPSAEVIVANPNGITCAGCGFINTTRGTLTTGTPIFGGDGSLSAFQVDRGLIAINGNGFDTNDRIDLLARAIQINAGLWAGQANAITGANRIGYADLSTQTIAGAGAAPAFGLDVAALGGMYASKIKLVGTEGGVGVRSAGELVATGGDFTLTNNGEVQLTGRTAAAGNVLVNAMGNAALTGRNYAQGDLSVTGNAVVLGGDTSAGRMLSANSASTLNVSGTTQASTLQLDAMGNTALAGQLQSTQDTTIRTVGTLANTGQTFAGGNLTLAANDLIQAQGAQLAAQGRLGAQVRNAIGNGGVLIGNGGLSVAAATLDNRGQIYSGTNANLEISGTATNSGSLTAAQALDVNAGSLNSAGELGSTSGSATLATTGDLSATGRTIAAGPLAATSGGAMTVAGQTYGGTGVSLHAQGNLTSTGTIDSTAAVALHSGANLYNTAKIVAAGDIDLQAAAALTNTADLQAVNIRARAQNFDNGGRLLASGDVSAAGTQALRNTGTIIAGLRSDGTVGSTGKVALASDGSLTQAGTVLAGQAIVLAGNTLVLTGGQTNSGGDLHLTSVADIDNTDSTLSARNTLSLTTQGAVKNAQGQLNGAQVQIAAASLDNTQGAIVQSGTAPFSVNLSGALTNAGGRIAANADSFSISAGSLDNTGGHIEHAGAGAATVASGAALANTNGLIVSNGALTTSAAGTLTNTGGTISGVGTTAVSADVLDNAAGVIAGTGNVAINSTHALDNRAGAIVQRGTGALSVSAGRLDNSVGGLVGAAGVGTVSVAGDLDNTNGTLYAQNALTASAGANLINRTGAIQSGGALTLGAGGTLDNASGQIDANGATQIAAAALANTTGRLVNNSVGALNINVSGALDNRGGTLGNSTGDAFVSANAIDNGSDGDGTNGGRVIAGRDLALDSVSVNNAGGLLYAERNLSAQNASVSIDNTEGEIGAGNSIALAADTLTNTDGRITANDVDLGLNHLENTRGQIAAYNQLNAQLGGLTGTNGRLFGHQEAAIHLAGDYTHQDQQAFASNGLLALTVDGTLTNAGTLESQGSLTVNAGAVVNTATGSLNSSNASNTGVTQVTAATLTNAGRIEGDGITLTANDIVNSGAVIGSRVWIEADRLTNGRDLGSVIPASPYGEGFIGATESVDLRVSERVDNLDAEIFSLGDLSIAGRTSGTRVGNVRNSSGRINAEGDVYIGADNILNERRLIELQQHTLTAAEQAASQQQSVQTLVPVVDDDVRATLSAWYDNNAQVEYGHDGGEFTRNPTALMWTVDEYQTETTLLQASAEGQIKAGGDIYFDATGDITNRASAIAAGQNFTVNGNAYGSAGANVNDIAINGTRSGTRTEWAWVRVADQVDPSPYARWQDGGWHDDHPEFSISVGATAITATTGTLLSSTITAGQAVVIDAHNVTNTGVATVGGPTAVAPTSGWAGSAPTAPTLGSGAPVAAITDGTSATAPTTGGNTPPVQVIGTPENPLPNLVPPTGQLYIRDPNGRYLIETDPRFANYGTWLGSDYLLGKLGYSPDGRLKRLGDDFYETQLVLQQITGLTGRKYLAASNGLDQYRDLMDAGASVAGRFGLSIGIALTSQQIAALDQDIVWLVEQTVEGQKVLVPVVYLSQASAQKYRLDGAVISANTVAINATGNVNNRGGLKAAGDLSLSAKNLLNEGGAISAGGVAYLSALDDVVNRNGTITGGQVAIIAGRDLISETRITGLGTPVAGIASQGDLSLSAGRDLSLIGTSVNAQGNAALSAGRDLSLASANNALGTHGALAPAARTTVDVGGNLGLSAGRDLSVKQSSASAGGNLVATAGRHLSVTSAAGPVQSVTTSSEQTRRHSDGGTQQDLDTASLSAGKNLVLSAGQDVNLTAAQLNAGNAVALQAGRDLNSSTVTTTDTQLSYDQGSKSKRLEFASDQTVHGTTINAGSDIALQAGQDITLQAATVTSETGGIGLSAGRDVNLTAAQEEHTTLLDTSKKKSGTFSSTKTTTHDKSTDSLAMGTTLSGETVAIAAGRDVTAQGAQVVGTGDVVIAAGRDLTLEAAQSTRTEEHSQDKKKSGLMSGMGSGIGITIGSRKQGQSMESTQTLAEGSTVGSVAGSVTLVAGQDLTVRGSDVVSATGTQVVGQNVTITSAEQTLDRTDSSYFKQSGLNVAVGGGMVDTALAAYSAANRSGEVEDGRLSALYAAQAGYAAKDTYSGAQKVRAAAANGDSAASASGVNVRITVGSQSSTNSTHTQETTQRGSSFQSGGDIAITATGDGQGNGGDLRIIGSKVDGKNVDLTAANDLIIKSSENTYSSESRSKSQGGEIGVAISADQNGGAAAGLYLSANVARGKADGESTSHNESLINASDTLTFSSGNDTTLQGVQLTANRVIGQVGNNLTVTSEQDTDTYKNQNASAQGEMTIGYGFTGSATVSASSAQSDYASVTQQTGIAAGKGGFDINVGNHTQLNGAALASAAAPDQNRLSTNSLSVEDIKNTAEYSAYSASFSTSGGQAGQAPAGSNVYSAPSGGGSASPGLSVPQNEDASSTTSSGIAAGTLNVRNGDTSAVASIDRSVTTLQQQGLKPIFDEQEVQERLELGQVAGQVGFRTAGALAEQLGWKEGSKEKAILHGLVGAATAALGGGDALQGLTGAVANQMAFNAMRDYLKGQGYDEKSAEFKSMMQWGSMAVGLAAGGGSGGATALSATQNNWLLHSEIEAANEARAGCEAQGGNVQACKDSITHYMDELDAARDKQLAEYYHKVEQELKDEGLAFTLTKEEYETEGMRRLEEYWAGTDRSQVTLGGDPAADSLGYIFRSFIGSFQSGGAATLDYLASHTSGEAIEDGFRGLLSTIGSSAAAFGEYATAPIPADVLQRGLDLGSIQTTQDKADIVAGTVIGLVSDGVARRVFNTGLPEDLVATASANAERFGYKPWETLPDWDRAEVMALTDLENQGFKVVNVQRDNGTGFDGFGYNPKTGEVVISEVKNYTAKPCPANDCTALGMGGRSDPEQRFKGNINQVLAEINNSPVYSEADKIAIRRALADDRYTVQLYGGSAGFKPSVVSDLSQLDWFRNANIPPPKPLPPVPPKTPPPPLTSTPKPPGEG